MWRGRAGALVFCVFLSTCFALGGADGLEDIEKWFDGSSVEKVKAAAKRHDKPLIHVHTHEVSKEAAHEAPKDRFVGWGHKKKLEEGWLLEHKAKEKAAMVKASGPKSKAGEKKKASSERGRRWSAKERLRQLHQQEAAKTAKLLKSASAAAATLMKQKEAARKKQSVKQAAFYQATLKKAQARMAAEQQQLSKQQKHQQKPAESKEDRKKQLAMERLKARKLVYDMKRLLSDAENAHKDSAHSKTKKLSASLQGVETIEKMLKAVDDRLKSGHSSFQLKDVEKSLTSSGTEDGESSQQNTKSMSTRVASPQIAHHHLSSGQSSEVKVDSSPPAPKSLGHHYHGPPARKEWLPVPGFQNREKWLLNRTPG